MVDVEKNRVLTFDVGGSHVSAALCFADDYRLGPVASALYEAVESCDGFIDLLANLRDEALAGLDGDFPAVLAVPGPFDLPAGISLMRHKLPYLYGVNLRQALASRFGCNCCQVRFLNDADAYLLGEVGAGAARGYDRAVGLTLGTGIGSAFAVEGKVLTEGKGIPKDGEIWNLPYENGIVEDSLSARAISSTYLRTTGQLLTPAELAAAAPEDAAARGAFTEFGRHLGVVIRDLLGDFGADVIVLGGGISRSSQWFLPATCAQLQGRQLELRVSELQDQAPLVGGGVAWFDEASKLATY